MGIPYEHVTNFSSILLATLIAVHVLFKLIILSNLYFINIYSRTIILTPIVCKIFLYYSIHAAEEYICTETGTLRLQCHRPDIHYQATPGASDEDARLP
jgi:hypothetical protein